MKKCMGLHALRLVSAQLAPIALLFISALSWGQPTPRTYRCLTAAHDIQIANFKLNHKYILKSEELKKRLPLGCREIAYEVSPRGNSGYRITLELNSEVWSVTETDTVTKGGRAGPHTAVAVSTKTNVTEPSAVNAAAGDPVPMFHPPEHSDAPQSPNVQVPLSLPAVGPRPALNAQDKSAAPMAIFAKPVEPPPPSLFNLLSKIPKFEPHLDAATKLNNCFARSTYETPTCVQMFTDIDIRCRGAVDPPSELCTAFDKAMKSVNFDKCYDDESQFGKCELRRAQMESICANPLSSLKSECQSFRIYMSSFMPTKPSKRVTRVPAQDDGIKPTESCAKGDRQMCVAEYCRMASSSGATKDDLDRCAQAQGLQSGQSSIRYLTGIKPMSSSLLELSRLRPVTYIWKASQLRDLGFIAENVSNVNPLLATYTEDGQIQGVKYGQMSALLTGGVQELYGMTLANSEQQGQLAHRLEDLERQNAQLVHENKSLVERMDSQLHELQSIKAKLGFK